MPSDKRREKPDPNHPHQPRYGSVPYNHPSYPTTATPSSPTYVSGHRSPSFHSDINQIPPYDPSLASQIFYPGPGSPSGMSSAPGYGPLGQDFNTSFAHPHQHYQLPAIPDQFHPWDQLLEGAGHSSGCPQRYLDPLLTQELGLTEQNLFMMGLQSPPATTQAFGRFGTPSSPTSPGRGSSDEKRTRNTEASARFRARKKERNTELQRSIAKLQERADALERSATELRRENSWLKELAMLRSQTQELLAQQAAEEEQDEDEEQGAGTKGAGRS